MNKKKKREEEEEEEGGWCRVIIFFFRKRNKGMWNVCSKRNIKDKRKRLKEREEKSK